MIIFKKQFEKTGKIKKEGIDKETEALLEEAKSLVERAGQGVKSDRSPITLIEKVQMSDTTKLVKKYMIDLTKDIEKGRDMAGNADKLRKAVAALKTSIDNIL